MPYGYDVEEGEQAPSLSSCPQWPIFNTQGQRQPSVSAAAIAATATAVKSEAKPSPVKGVAHARDGSETG